MNGGNIAVTDGTGGRSVALASLRLSGRAETDSASRVSVGLKDAIDGVVDSNVRRSACCRDAIVNASDLPAR